jgi:SAM-dependent methyltransferase
MRRHYKALGRSIVRCAATAMGRMLPLSVRQSLVASRVGRSSRGGLEFALGMLRDLHGRDAGAFHRFLWSNHVGYAASYEVGRRFGASNLNPSRRILVDDIGSYLLERGVDPRKTIRSVLDVGCSLGYLLHHVEVSLCPSAEVIHGIDIDEYAINAGRAHLSSLESKVQLFVADMAGAGRFIGGRAYDLILCCGVLMYGDEQCAYEVVRTMLRSANRLVGIISLAEHGNFRTAAGRSIARPSDGAFIHDVSRMIHLAGGRVAASRRIETEISGSSPSHAVLAEPVLG